MDATAITVDKVTLIIAGSRDSHICQRQRDSNAIIRARIFNTDQPRSPLFIAQHPAVASGTDAGMLHPEATHNINPLIDRITFGDTAQVQIYLDRKSTRLNSSHVKTSYTVFCLKKK